MVIDFRATAVHGVNAYIWDKLQEHLKWNKADYGGLVPITTPQEQPEFQDVGKPYIVYNYSTASDPRISGVKVQTVIYSIKSANESDLREALNLVEYFLGGEDLSANDVNEFLSGQAFYDQFDYKSIEVRPATGAAPAEQEGGFLDARIEFHIKFTSSRVRGFENESINIP